MKLNSKVRFPVEIYRGNGQFTTVVKEGILLKFFRLSSGYTFVVIQGEGIKHVIGLDTFLRYNPTPTKDLDDWL